MLLPAAAARCWGWGSKQRRWRFATGLSGWLRRLRDCCSPITGNLPSGPAIVLAAGSLFGISLAAAGAWRRLMPMIGRVGG